MKKVTLNLVILIIIMICYQITNGQSFSATNWYTAGFSHLGYDSPSGTLDIGVGSANPIYFWTNGGTAYPYTGSPKMTIQGNSTTTDGYVGIGCVSPIHQLDVNYGSINIKTRDSAYMIDDTAILFHNGNSTNLFCGIGAGGSILNGSANTYVGNFAGHNGNGSNNTMLGHKADVLSPDITNATAIGSNSKVAASNSMVLGDGTINVGIGTSKPQTTLDVHGTISANQILINNQDLLALVLQLQGEVNSLKQQLLVMKN